jgi:hypothetical protein
VRNTAGGAQTKIAWPIRSRRFSAAITKVRAEMGLHGFQSRGIRASVLAGNKGTASASENRFGIEATAYGPCLAASASMAVNKADSLPAIKIPPLMAILYRQQEFMTTVFANCRCHLPTAIGINYYQQELPIVADNWRRHLPTANAALI